jgi:hypothetical protein
MPKPTTLALLAATFCVAGFASKSQAQGGWRQWQIRLRDGSLLEANPLGAPNDDRLSLSVGAYDGHERRIARSRVQAVVALPFPGEALPAVPTIALCKDAIVRRDGTTTTGRITLVRVRWSEGVVVQRGDTVNLRDVAYLVFATQSSQNVACQREAPRREPDFTFPCVPYSIGSRRMHRLCADDRWT